MKVECEVSYDAAQDRLVGGDFVREAPARGVWLRSFLMPETHARRLVERLEQLHTVFGADNTAGDHPPYPRALTIIAPGALPGAIDGRPQMVPLELAFATAQLRSAPAEYRQAVQLVCMVQEPTTLVERPPDTASGRRDLATNMFSVLRCAHRRLHLALSRGGGSSVDPAALSPAGHFQDLYFLVGPGDLPGAELRRSQQRDLTRALSLLITPGGDRDAVHSVLSDAVAAYWGTRSFPTALSLLIGQIASDVGAAPPQRWAELGEAVLSGGW
jgi:hypothetical protein